MSLKAAPAALLPVGAAKFRFSVEWRIQEDQIHASAWHPAEGCRGCRRCGSPAARSTRSDFAALPSRELPEAGASRRKPARTRVARSAPPANHSVRPSSGAQMAGRRTQFSVALGPAARKLPGQFRAVRRPRTEPSAGPARRSDLGAPVSHSSDNCTQTMPKLDLQNYGVHAADALAELPGARDLRVGVRCGRSAEPGCPGSRWMSRPGSQTTA